MSNSTFFAPKTLLFREGDDATNLMIIKSGEVVCLKSSKERLIPVFLAKGQDIIGESAMLSGAPYTYSAIALSPEWITDLTTTMVSRFQSTASLVAENRVLHPSILSEEEFTPSLEIEYKKILSQ